MPKIEDNELWYALAGALLIFVFFKYGMDILGRFLVGVDPFFGMLIFASVVFVGFWLLSSILEGSVSQLKFSIGSTLFLLGADVLYPPFLVAKDGAINKTVEFWYASSDVGVASLWSHVVSPQWIYFMTYTATPILLMVIIPIILLAPDQIKELLGFS